MSNSAEVKVFSFGLIVEPAGTLYGLSIPEENIFFFKSAVVSVSLVVTSGVIVEPAGPVVVTSGVIVGIVFQYGSSAGRTLTLSGN